MSRTRLLVAFLLLASASANAARLVEWVELAPVSDDSRIALGYPVPVPVDTAQPFNGFRSYNGLHMRHQDLAATTPWVHGEVIGSTRLGRSIWRSASEVTRSRWTPLASATRPSCAKRKTAEIWKLIPLGHGTQPKSSARAKRSRRSTPRGPGTTPRSRATGTRTSS